MRPTRSFLTTALVGTTSALLVSPNSPCSQYCGNVLSSTTGSDIVCDDGSFSGNSAGTVFETCINCELTSTYTSDNQSDLQWLIYNLRYALSYCLAGQPNNPDFQVSPCTTSTACLPLDSAFYWDNLTTQDSTYSFCNGWIETQVPKCKACLEAGTTRYLMNYVTVLDAACSQLPSIGSTVSVQGTPFSTIPMNVTTPSQTPLYTYTPGHSALSLGGKVGIAIGGLAFILSVAGFAIVCNGRRRRRAYLKSLELHHGRSGWPSPSVGYSGQDMFETPTSQKPLRGWDDHSPMTASSENNPFPRYFSPYSSQYNSPVSATDIKTHTWPTVASMNGAFSASGSKPVSDFSTGAEYDPGVGSSSSASRYQTPMQEQRERVGVAVNEYDQSMHNGNPNVASEVAHESSSQSGPSQLQAESKHIAVFGLSRNETKSNESYELREIDSNGYPIASAPTQVPALRHPGYGRGSQSSTPSAPPTPPQTSFAEANPQTGNFV